MNTLNWCFSEVGLELSAKLLLSNITPWLHSWRVSFRSHSRSIIQSVLLTRDPQRRTELGRNLEFAVPCSFVFCRLAVVLLSSILWRLFSAAVMIPWRFVCPEHFRTKSRELLPTRKQTVNSAHKIQKQNNTNYKTENRKVSFKEFS